MVKLITKAQLKREKLTSYNSGYTDGKLEAEKDTAALREAKQTIKDLKEDLKRTKTQVSVLEEEREEHREMYLLKLANEDVSRALDARRDSLRKDEKRIEEAEANLANAEEGNYKKGYADGVADGLRKVHEITAEDRENAMKIAMVSAASHTSTDNLKELNNVHKLTEGKEPTS